MTKNFLKGEYQLIFELVNKALLSYTEKRATVIGPNLFPMDTLFKYKKVNLLAILIDHMNIVMREKDGKHGLAYRFWMNRIFLYFTIECVPGKIGSVK